mgnify:CR=1 FL=1
MISKLRNKYLEKRINWVFTGLLWAKEKMYDFMNVRQKVSINNRTYYNIMSKIY